MKLRLRVESVGIVGRGRWVYMYRVYTMVCGTSCTVRIGTQIDWEPTLAEGLRALETLSRRYDVHTDTKGSR